METGVPVPEAKETKKSTMYGCMLLIGIAFAALVAAFLLWAYYFDSTIPTFGVNSASLNSRKITSSRLVGELDIVFNVTNHNTYHKASYDTVSISCLNSNMNNQSTLASTSLEPFSLKISDTLYKKAQFNIDVPFSNGTTIEFEIVLSTNFKLKSILGSKHKSLKLVCKPLSMSRNPGSSNWILVHAIRCN